MWIFIQLVQFAAILFVLAMVGGLGYRFLTVIGDWQFNRRVKRYKFPTAAGPEKATD
jgi:hypothetical protein